MTDFNNTTVQEAADGEIVLVGEEHRNSRSAALAERMLEEVEPETVAIEMSPGSKVRSGGMGRIVEYHEENDVPLVYIDDPDKRERFQRVADSVTELVREANYFEEPIDEDGDLPRQQIHDIRDSIEEQFGEEARRAMYETREQHMAEVLQWALAEYQTPIVAGIGTYHILALKDVLDRIGITRYPGSNGVIDLAPA